MCHQTTSYNDLQPQSFSTQDDVFVFKSTGFEPDPQSWGGISRLDCGGNDDAWDTSNQNEKHFFTGDLNGGRHDIYLGKNSPGSGTHPEFIFNSSGIRHPDSRAWTSFELHVKNVDGSSSGDELVWIKNTTGASDIYVGTIRELRDNLVKR